MKKERYSNERLNEIQDLLVEVRNTNNQVHDTYSKLDTKIAFYFTLTTSIVLLFIRFVKIPEFKLEFFVYSLAIFIFILILILLILTYNPKTYKSIDTNKLLDKYYAGKYSDRLDFNERLTFTISDNTATVMKINKLKAERIFVCSWMIFSGIILILMLIIFGGA